MCGDSPVTGHLFDCSRRIVEKYSRRARIHKAFGRLRTLRRKRSFAGFPVVRVPSRICEVKVWELSYSIWLGHGEGLLAGIVVDGSAMYTYSQYVTLRIGGNFEREGPCGREVGNCTTACHLHSHLRCTAHET